MAITKKQVVIGASVIYLLVLSSLAAYALHLSHAHSLPIPDVISALAIALPPLAGLALEVTLALNEKLAARGQLQTSRIFQIVIAFFLVYESVLATLAGAHISPPGSLTCALRERWQDLYRAKEGGRIKAIQDAGRCCGLMSTKDMAWPLQDATHEADACLVRYEERVGRSCLEFWRGEERKVAVMLLVVPVAVFLWKVAIVLAPSSGSGWLPSQIRLPRESLSSAEGSVGRRTRPAIAYRDLEENEEGDSIQQEVNRLNKDSRLASHIERNRTKSSGLLDDAARWRE